MAQVNSRDLNNLGGYKYNTSNQRPIYDKELVGMDDGDYSVTKTEKKYTLEEAKNTDDPIYQSIKHSHNLFDREEIDLFRKTYRFGLFNPYGTVTNTREFLFFTKPDLNIYLRLTDGTYYGGPVLNSTLKSIPYWADMISSRKRILNELQAGYSSGGTVDNFNHLLQNQVVSNLEIPSLESKTIDTPTNMYGVGFSYRGSSEASDDSIDFSLEFKDTKWLDVYYYFKSYEEYETLKHHGLISPFKEYILNKVIHDQFSIYKFLVDEDMETIIYWGKYYGVMPLSLPRDVFSSATFDNGISFPINFKAAFFEDMKPEIISDFNSLSAEFYNSLPYQIDIYNDVLNRVDNRPAQAAYVEQVASNISPNGYVYKLRWRGSDKA